MFLYVLCNTILFYSDHINRGTTPATNERICYKLLLKYYFILLYSKTYISLFHECTDIQFHSAELECSASNSNFTVNSTRFDRKSRHLVTKNREFWDILRYNNVFIQENHSFKKYQRQETLLFFDNYLRSLPIFFKVKTYL